MVPLRAYSGISESLEVALHVYSSRDCSTMRLHIASGDSSRDLLGDTSCIPLLLHSIDPQHYQGPCFMHDACCKHATSTCAFICCISSVTLASGHKGTSLKGPTQRETGLLCRLRMSILRQIKFSRKA